MTERQPHIPDGFLLPRFSVERLKAVAPHHTVVVIIRQGEMVTWTDNDGLFVDMSDPWFADSVIDLRSRAGNSDFIDTISLQADTDGRVSVSSPVGYDVIFVSRTAGALLSYDQIRRLVTYNVNDPAWFIERYGVAAG